MVVPAKAGTHGTVAWNYQNAGAPAAVGNEIGGCSRMVWITDGSGIAPPAAAASLEAIE